jgi:hypothetical protein
MRESLLTWPAKSSSDECVGTCDPWRVGRPADVPLRACDGVFLSLEGSLKAAVSPISWFTLSGVRASWRGILPLELIDRRPASPPPTFVQGWVKFRARIAGRDCHCHGANFG